MHRFLLSCDGDRRDLHVLTHSFPTRRSSDLARTRRANVYQVLRAVARLEADARDGPAVRFADIRPRRDHGPINPIGGKPDTKGPLAILIASIGIGSSVERGVFRIDIGRFIAEPARA